MSSATFPDEASIGVLACFNRAACGDVRQAPASAQFTALAHELPVEDFFIGLLWGNSVDYLFFHLPGASTHRLKELAEKYEVFPVEEDISFQHRGNKVFGRAHEQGERGGCKPRKTFLIPS